MNIAVRLALEGLRFGEPLYCGDLVIIPLLMEGSIPVPEYRALGEAFDEGKVTVTEVDLVGKQSQIRIANQADQPVMGIVGQEFVGAYQNRILNTTVLVAPKTEIVVPVSCSEAGRWLSLEHTLSYRPYRCGFFPAESLQELTVRLISQDDISPESFTPYNESFTPYNRLRHIVDPSGISPEGYEAEVAAMRRRHSELSDDLVRYNLETTMLRNLMSKCKEEDPGGEQSDISDIASTASVAESCATSVVEWQQLQPREQGGERSGRSDDTAGDKDLFDIFHAAHRQRLSKDMDGDEGHERQDEKVEESRCDLVGNNWINVEEDRNSKRTTVDNAFSFLICQHPRTHPDVLDELRRIPHSRYENERKASTTEEQTSLRKVFQRLNDKSEEAVTSGDPIEDCRKSESTAFVGEADYMWEEVFPQIPEKQRKQILLQIERNRRYVNQLRFSMIFRTRRRLSNSMSSRKAARSKSGMSQEENTVRNAGRTGRKARESASIPSFREGVGVAPASLRFLQLHNANTNLQNRYQFWVNQSAVWSAIDTLHRQLKIRSSTAAMADVFLSYGEQLKTFIEAFPYLPGQIGMIVLHNRQVIGMEFVTRTSVYRFLHPKLIRGYVIDAIVPARASHSRGAEDKSVWIEQAERFVEQILHCVEHQYRAVGLGTEYRYHDDCIVGSALVYQDCVAHAVFFSNGQPRDRSITKER